MEKVLCFDIGGTFIKSAAVNIDGSIYFESKIRTPSDYTELLAVLNTTASALPEKMVGISLAVPGGYDFKSDTVFAPNLKTLNGRFLRTDVEKMLNLPVKAENDANLAALGEYVFSDKKAYRNMAFITLGTGAGGGMIIDGAIPASDISLFEVGHTQYMPNGRACGCGREGCFDEYISSGGLLNTFRELGGDAKGITELEKLASNGDPLALQTFDIFARQLAALFANITNLFCPQKIKIGGGLSELSRFYLEAAIKYFDASVFPLYKGRTSIEISELKNQAGLLGAAAHFFNHTKKIN